MPCLRLEAACAWRAMMRGRRAWATRTPSCASSSTPRPEVGCHPHPRPRSPPPGEKGSLQPYQHQPAALVVPDCSPSGTRHACNPSVPRWAAASCGPLAHRRARPAVALHLRLLETSRPPYSVPRQHCPPTCGPRRPRPRARRPSVGSRAEPRPLEPRSAAPEPLSKSPSPPPATQAPSSSI